MCTLTYIPFSNGDFLVTSNRDEGTQRKPASLPQSIPYSLGHHVLAPIDGEAGGSWIGVSDDHRMAVLLNGAFAAHKHHPPYRKSRGLVVLDAFGYPGFPDFCNDYGLNGIEPFTMVMITYHKEPVISILQWDGQRKYQKEADAQRPHIWMAPKLYPEDSMRKAGEEFQKFLNEKPEPTVDEALQFHTYQHYRDKMIRHGHEPVKVVDTLSTSQLRYFGGAMSFHHIDRRVHITAAYDWK
jgi:hypothetical protein